MLPPNGIPDPATLRALRGEHEDSDVATRAWSAVYAALNPAVRALVRSKVPAADVEDVVAETWGRASKSIQHYRAQAPLLAWVQAIARAAISDALRGRRDGSPAPAPSPGADRRAWAAVRPAADPAAPTAEALLEGIDADRLVAALTPDDRTLWDLWVRRDLPKADVARALGITERAAAEQFLRFRRRVRRIWQALNAR